MAQKSERLTIRLGEAHAELLNKLEDFTGLNRTRLVRVMLDQTAKNFGMEPVSEIPKSLSLADQSGM